MIDLTSRDYLIELREHALVNSDAVINEAWKRTYIELADAADKLDAMLARTTIYSDETVVNDVEEPAARQ